MRVELTDNEKETTEKAQVDSIVSSRRGLLKSCHTLVQPNSGAAISYELWEARVTKAELACDTAYGALSAAKEDVEQALIAARKTQEAEQWETVKVRSATVEDLRKSFMSDAQGLLDAATILPYDLLSAAISRAGSRQTIPSKMAAGPSDEALYGTGQVKLDNAQVNALAHDLSAFLEEQQDYTAVRQ